MVMMLQGGGVSGDGTTCMPDLKGFIDMGAFFCGRLWESLACMDSHMLARLLGDTRTSYENDHGRRSRRAA